MAEHDGLATRYDCNSYRLFRNTEPGSGTQTLTPTTYYKTVKSYYNGKIGIVLLKCLGWVMGK